MEIQQKKRKNKHHFTFNDEHLNFAYEDKTGSGDFDVNYVDLPSKTSILIETNEWLRNVGYLWIALGVIQIGYAIATDASLSGKGFWLMVGAACVAWAHFTRVKYSVLKTEHGNLFIIQDKKHDSIYEELMDRRKSQLLRWYGDVNPENELQAEISKFNWLKEQKVLTEEEAEQKIAQAQLVHKESYVLPGERLN